MSRLLLALSRVAQVSHVVAGLDAAVAGIQSDSDVQH
jgi:hypothetical protein